MAMRHVVLKVGGNVLLDAAQVKALAGEAAALRAAGCRITVVHGGGPQLDKALAALGEKVEKLDGLRVTSPAAANVVRQVLDEIGAALATAFNLEGVPARHVAAGARHFQSSEKRIPAGDLQRVGKVQRFTGAAALREDPAVAVVTPVGWDAQGPLNVNADEGAAAVAAALRADWLVLATDVAAVRDASGKSLERLTPRAARKLIADSAATGGMIPKLNAAVSALAQGVSHVLITNVQPGTVTDAVLAGRAQGTLVEDDLQVLS